LRISERQGDMGRRLIFPDGIDKLIHYHAILYNSIFNYGLQLHSCFFQQLLRCYRGYGWAKMRLTGQVRNPYRMISFTTAVVMPFPQCFSASQ
jgi:hypothetical protein